MHCAFDGCSRLEDADVVQARKAHGVSRASAFIKPQASIT
jgi:hypothetical protein